MQNQIIKTKGYKIEQHNNSYILSIHHGPPNKKYIYEIYKSITDTKILSTAFFNEEEEEEDSEETIIFTAETVKPLSRLLKEYKLTNQDIIKMIHDLGKQIAYLEINSIAFYGYNLDDILVINDNTFIIASIKHIIKIEPDKCVYFYSPINIPYFSSPELNKLTNLPSKIDYRSGYYSLGALILFSLTNIYIFAEISEENLQIDKILYPIYYTKMYWFLRRCFYEKSEERILLFI
jgi:hypothetical protein